MHLAFKKVHHKNNENVNQTIPWLVLFTYIVHKLRNNYMDKCITKIGDH